jgi:hypothetical protein
MRGHGGVIAGNKLASKPDWLEIMRDGMNKHRRFVWIKRGGPSGTGGSGPQGRKATRRAMLSRSLADRPLVAAAVTARQAAAVLAKATPRRIIWP